MEREEDPIKSWKLSVGDWKEREHWNDYIKAYEDALNRWQQQTSAWFIVPADKKWFRNLAIAETLRRYADAFQKDVAGAVGTVGQERKKGDWRISPRP